MRARFPVIVRLEREFDGGLQNARAAHTVDVANAAAKSRGYLTEVGSDRGGGEAEGRCVGHVKGIEARFQQVRLADRKSLGEGEVVRDVRRPAELIAPGAAERARNRVGC